MIHLPDAVPTLLHTSPYVRDVELCGSRATGTATEYSDWDFAVTTSDFGAVRADLPELVSNLVPLVCQWDRLSDHACFMLIIAGPTKIDLIFNDIRHDHEPPWTVDAHTLPAIDGQFWDWTLWLTSKVAKGDTDLVALELQKMHEHLLLPMGITQPPASLTDAATAYVDARAAWCKRTGTVPSDQLEPEVLRVLVSLQAG